jgi:two-component system chemotaxis sensor kinase CheA
MPISDKMLKELMATFQAELQEHLEMLSKGLLSLEQNPASDERSNLLTNIFRAAHSIKGGARAVNLKDIETMAHRIEDVLVKIREGGLSLTPAHFDHLLSAVDAIATAMAAHLRGEQLSDGLIAPILDRLDNIISSSQTPVSQDSEPPPTPPQPSPPSQASPSLRASSPPQAVKDQQPMGSPPIRADETIRVKTTKLDALMDGLSELLVMQMRMEKLLGQVKTLQERTVDWQKKWLKARPECNRLRRQNPNLDKLDLTPIFDFLEKNEEELKALSTDLNTLLNRSTHDSNHLQLVTENLQTGIHSARMLPIATLFNQFPRMVRDLARDQGKEIVLEREGQETEVDRQALELMKDPLTHLLRNAVDHGVEVPEDRLASGKPRQGTIRLRAEQRGNNLVLTVFDDGRGIDVNAVRRAAVERDLVSSGKIADLSEREVVDLIFHSGLSTARQITDLSGRGVGMDVVQKNLEQARGSIRVETQLGLGTTFTLTLPITLTTSQVLLVRVAGDMIGLPMMNVERILHVDVKQIGTIEGHPAIYADGHPLSLISLANALKLPEMEQSLPSDAKIPTVILSMAEMRIALRVGGFLSTQQVVVKPLGGQLRRVRNIAGAAILGDGQLVTILNVSDLMKSIQAKPDTSWTPSIVTKEARRWRVLLVDDSITTRALEKHILESAGYEVLAAADGQEAWELICRNERGLPDLVVSDVNMPKMDGFTLTQSIKNDGRYSRMPVVLVTSLESSQDRLHGMEAGADAYIIKSTFDQRELLDTIERMIK